MSRGHSFTVVASDRSYLCGAPVVDRDGVYVEQSTNGLWVLRKVCSSCAPSQLYLACVFVRYFRGVVVPYRLELALWTSYTHLAAHLPGLYWVGGGISA
jgi:hypothetical protein